MEALCTGTLLTVPAQVPALPEKSKGSSEDLSQQVVKSSREFSHRVLRLLEQRQPAPAVPLANSRLGHLDSNTMLVPLGCHTWGWFIPQQDKD